MSGCDSGGTDPSPDASALGDVTGAITGQVIDNATSNPIQGARVVVAVGSLGTDGESFSATTDSEGRFALRGLPAATADAGSDSSEGPSSTYGIRVETPDGSAYRDAYRGQVELAYGNNETGAIELVANITFPLKKTNGSLSADLDVQGSGEPLRNTAVRVQQRVDVEFDANGDATGGNGTLSVSATDSTDAQGTVTFDNLVVGERTSLFARFEGDFSEDFIGSGFVPDEGSAAPVERSVSVPDFEIVSITPDPATDIDADTARPSFTFTFNRPVDDNETVNSLADDGDIFITNDNPARKDLTANGDIKVATSFNGDRTELTVTPTQDLSDGFRYFHVGASGAQGFDDPEFVDGKYGDGLVNPDDSNIDFTVGLNNSAPATPSLSFNPDDGNVNDDGTLEAGSYDYDDSQVNMPLQIDEVDNSAAEVKGYEVFYSSQDIREDRSANAAAEFLQAGVYENSFVTNTLGGNYEVSDNIVDASNAEFGNGRVTFTAGTDDGIPFAAEDGSYGDVQVKVRAVSINNVRSDFSNTLTIADNDSLNLDQVNTEYSETDNNGNPTELTVTFYEPVDESTVAAGGFTLDNGGSGSLTIESVTEVNNTKPPFEAGEVVLELSETSSQTFDDELTVAEDRVTDLAGNPVDTDDDTDNDL